MPFSGIKSTVEGLLFALHQASNGGQIMQEQRTIQVYDRTGAREIPYHINGEIVPAPTSHPISAKSSDPYAPYAHAMEGVRTVYQADPISRGAALLLKTLGVSLFLWGLTLAALAMLDSLSFMVWLFFAGVEGFACFVVFAVLDYREQPMAIRAQLAAGFLQLMQNEQTVRQIATYGIDTVRQAREVDQ
jgi:hypothetical protein